MVIDGLEDAEDHAAFELAVTANYDAQSAVERELVLSSDLVVKLWTAPERPGQASADQFHGWLRRLDRFFKRMYRAKSCFVIQAHQEMGVPEIE